VLSIIVPTYKDSLLNKTIDSLLENTGDVEILVVLDGCSQEVREDKRVKVIRLGKNLGMRGAINAGLAEARGEFIMKIDSHCKVGEGFDKIMAENCAENWLTVPRRYTLNVEKWERGGYATVKDYHYLSFPEKGLWPQEWRARTAERLHDPIIDDTMTFQGSCWCANRKYFMEHVGFLDDRPETYSTFAGDQLEIGLKYWLNGGENKVVKKTWYAHLFKNANYYRTQAREIGTHKRKMLAMGPYRWTAKHWMNNEEPNMLYKFEWLVEKFWPVPTWPEDRALWVIEDK